MMKKQSETDKPGTDTSWNSFARGLLHEIGLKHDPRCYLNYRFILAVLVGALFLLVFHGFMPPFSSSFEFNWAVFLSLVIWQPLIEEILFRGILQGQLIKTKWGQRSKLHISVANAVTSILFVVMHMINNPLLFSITVFVPSLLFGYFRDNYKSVYPSIILHSLYNAMVIIGLIIHGNMNISSL